MTENKVFIDTNIWIYAFLEEDSSKRNFVLDFLEEVLKKYSIILSIQVINEFHNVCLRKYKLEEDEILQMVEGIRQISKITPLTFDTYKLAYNLRKNFKFSFWDSLIVASAFENNCYVLYSEDMHHGVLIENLKIKNPFKDK